MNDTQFRQLGQQMLYQIQKVSNISETCDLFPQLEKLKLYIYKNPNNPYVKQFIEVFLELYTDLFFQKDLIEAFSISERFHYFKQIRIYNNLPYTVNPFYANILPKTICTPSEIYGDFYQTFLWTLEQYRPNLANSPDLKSILNFVAENQSIIHGSKDNYKNMANEINLYRQAIHGQELAELKDFAFMQSCMDLEEARRKFISKKIGNIGEICVFQLIEKQYFNYFVSRDIKNGFGYDIYYYDAYNAIENLIEVKTTTSNGEDDYFKMSENEYKVMKQCFNNPYARYYICRVHLDSALHPSYTLLSMQDDETLSNAEAEYKLCQFQNGERIFRKQDQKRKLL